MPDGTTTQIPQGGMNFNRGRCRGVFQQGYRQGCRDCSRRPPRPRPY